MPFRFEPAGERQNAPALLSRNLSRAALLLGALALPCVVAAQGKDDLWEVTSKMEMPGMPMAMPAQPVSRNMRSASAIERASGFCTCTWKPASSACVTTAQ